jgi:hypothetical protein
MSELDVDLDRRAAPTTDDGDHERFAHWVSPASAVTEALVTGTPVVALCGKVWTPTRDPKRYPVCPTCEEIRRTHFPPASGS